MDKEVKTVGPDVAVVMLHAVIASDYQGSEGLVGAGEGLLMVANTIDALQARVRELESALRGLIAEPHGCSLCHSGAIINHDKGHQPDCPFLAAGQALKGGA